MSNRQRTTLVTLLLVALLLIAGCAPRTGGGEVAGQAGEGEIVVDLPAMVIDYDAEGQPSLGGVPLSAVGVLPESLVSQITLDAEAIQQLQAANIQNVQVNNQTGGLSLSVNGAEIPSLSWDKDSLGTLASYAGVLSEDLAVVGEIAPLLTNLGFAAVLRFPAAEGAEEIPLDAESESATAAQAASDEFMGTVGNPPKIQIPIAYDAEGDFTIGGIAADQWAEMTGSPIDALKLEPDALANIKGAGVESIAVNSNADGLQMAINGQNMPYLDWSGGKLAPAIELLAATGQLDSLAESGMNLDALLPVLEQLLPILTSSDVQVSVSFE